MKLVKLLIGGVIAAGVIAGVNVFAEEDARGNDWDYRYEDCLKNGRGWMMDGDYDYEGRGWMMNGDYDYEDRGWMMNGDYDYEDRGWMMGRNEDGTYRSCHD